MFTNPPPTDIVKKINELNRTLPPGQTACYLPFQGCCAKCHGDMPEGTIGVHVPTVGMHHPECLAWARGRPKADQP